MENIPVRTLLDTNVVNFILDHDECIFENLDAPDHLNERDVADIDALRGIFTVGQRAQWQIAVSPLTYQEINATTDPDRRASLQRWFGELWHYWRTIMAEDGTLSDAYAEELAGRFGPAQILSAFPDHADRQLLAHAVAYECDALCTRDHKTIIKRLGKGPKLPFRVLTPSEWWSTIAPYARLWL